MFRKFKFGFDSSREARGGKGKRRGRGKRIERGQLLRRSGLGLERLEDRLTLTGDLDLSFDGDGWISGDFGLGRLLEIHAVAMQDDGKIVVAGSITTPTPGRDMIVARFNGDGSIDTTFGADGTDVDSLPDGYLQFDFPANPADDAIANDLVIDESGNIIVAGYVELGQGEFAIARLTSAGDLDASFDGDGRVQTAFPKRALGNSVALLSNGDIVVAGTIFNDATTGNTARDFAVALYDGASGALKSSFGAGGIVTTNFNFNSSGTIGRNDQAFDVVVQNVGGVDKIVVVGDAARISSVRTDFAIARYDLDGSLDATFGTGGKTIQALQGVIDPANNMSSASGVIIDQAGRIVVVGTVGDKTPRSSLGIARFGSNGSIDTSFNSSGSIAGTLNIDFDLVDTGTDIVLQPDGKYLVGGFGASDDDTTTANYTIGLARVLVGGTLDPSFGVGGIVENPVFASATIDSAANQALALSPDGKIVAAGSVDFASATNSDYFVARYQTGLTFVNAGGPYAASEGGTVGLVAIGGDSPDDYTWDLDSDGIFGETGGGAANGDEVGPNPTFSAANLDGLSTETITLRVDVPGVGFVFDTATVTISNVAPTLVISGDASVSEGSLYTLNLAATDPGDDTISSWSINWGDGSAIETVTGGLTSVTHAYADGNSNYTISATATDDDLGTYASNTLAVAVQNVAPTLAISGSASVNEGSLYTLNLASSDPGADTIASWTIDWGDGGTLQVVSGNPSVVTHTYADHRATPATIKAWATDDDGFHAAGNDLSVAVNNVAPSLAISGAGSSAEGAIYTLDLSSSDPGTDTITSWTIDWGDGSDAEVVVGNPSSVTHVYADGIANHAISATATDEDGTHAAPATVAVSVLNVEPELVINGAGSVAAGLTYTLDLSATDPGDDTITSWTIDWGDGSPVETVAGGTTSVTHVYTTGGFTRTIIASATDEDGNYGANTLEVDVESTSNEGVFLVDGVLNVVDSTGANNIVSISGSGGNVEVTLNGVTTTFSAEDVEEIQVTLSGGNDVVVANAAITAPMTIDGGAGNDLIAGGSGDDLLIGGTGNDVLVGGAGDDVLLGGEGNDDLIGGAGDNVLVGGAGSDIALGSAGRDLIIGSQDSDLLSGGSGEDILIGGHTIHDNDVDALDAIMAIWGSSASFNSRVNTLTGAGGMLEAGATVFDDEELDIILGGAGRDLIFGDTNPWDGAFDLIALQASQDRLIAVN